MLPAMNRSREWGSGRLARRAHRPVARGRLPRLIAWAERIGEERERRRTDAERLRIARELHDVVAYGFAAISLQAGTATHLMDRHPEELGDVLDAIQTVSRRALDELRGILGMLRDVDTARRPRPGLQELDELARLTTRAGVSTTLRISGAAQELPSEIDSAVYRIVQESLANVLRHAAASAASVSISFDPGCLTVSVEDDGNGVVNACRNELTGSGYGLPGMRERVVSLGGSLDAGPRAGIGYLVCARLPLVEAA
jgi:signal transduction histidine kinase